MNFGKFFITFHNFFFSPGNKLVPQREVEDTDDKYSWKGPSVFYRLLKPLPQEMKRQQRITMNAQTSATQNQSSSAKHKSRQKRLSGKYSIIELHVFKISDVQFHGISDSNSDSRNPRKSDSNSNSDSSKIVLDYIFEFDSGSKMKHSDSRIGIDHHWFKSITKHCKIRNSKYTWVISHLGLCFPCWGALCRTDVWTIEQLNKLIWFDLSFRIFSSHMYMQNELSPFALIWPRIPTGYAT